MMIHSIIQHPNTVPMNVLYRTRTVHEYTIYFIMKNIPGNIIIMIFTVHSLQCYTEYSV
jgi:hypothetical protein